MPATMPASFGGDDVALSTSAVLLYTASSVASRGEAEKIIIQNNSAINVTVGASDVADASNGVLIPGGENAALTIYLTNPGEEVYAVAASGTPSVQVARIG